MTTHRSLTLNSVLASAALLMLTACGTAKGGANQLLSNLGNGGAAGSGSGAASTGSGNTLDVSGFTVYGVDTSNQLFTVNTASISAFTTLGGVTGLETNEKILGVSFSPTGVLYALGGNSHIYTIDTTTGVATLVGSGPFSPALSGSKFGFSYNPVTDLIRITSDTGQNFTIDTQAADPSLTVTQGPALAYAAGDAHAGATPDIVVSSSSCSCDTAPTLYGIDAALGVFVSIGNFAGDPVPAGTGQLFTLGALGFNALSSTVALTLPDRSTVAYAAAAGTGTTFSKIYQIKLTDGTSTYLGDATSLHPIQSLSVLPN